jgi:hypothetical protein
MDFHLMSRRQLGESLLIQQENQSEAKNLFITDKLGLDGFRLGGNDAMGKRISKTLVEVSIECHQVSGKTLFEGLLEWRRGNL